MGDSHVLGISEFLQTPPGLTVDRVSIVIWGSPLSLSLSQLQQVPRMSERKLPWFRPVIKQQPSVRQTLENKVLEQYLVYSSESNYIYWGPAH